MVSQKFEDTKEEQTTQWSKEKGETTIYKTYTKLKIE